MRKMFGQKLNEDKKVNEESEEKDTQHMESNMTNVADQKMIISQLGFDYRFNYPNVQIN